MTRDSIEWDDYIGFDPGVDRPLHEVSRAAAREYFERFMRERPGRHEALRRLLEVNGVRLEEGDAGLDTLNDWFAEHVEGDRETMRLGSWWCVVARDIGIWVGDEMIRRAPALQWRFFTGGKTYESYQRPVVMGFGAAYEKYHVDPELLVVGLGERALEGDRDPGYLRQVVDTALELA